MHGYNSGLSMVKSLCLNFDIIMLQEHWLLTNNLSKLDNIDSNFQCCSISAMDNKAASGILVGRPFGGVAVLWRKSLSNRIKIVCSDDIDGRYISLKLCNSAARDIVMTCVYFPCITTRNDYVVAVVQLSDILRTCYLCMPAIII